MQTPPCTVQYIDGTSLWITCHPDLCRIIDIVDAAYLARSSSYEAYLKACQTVRSSLYFNINGQRNLLRIYSEKIELSVSNKVRLILQPIISNNGIRWTFRQAKIISKGTLSEQVVEELEEIEELEELDTEDRCCLDNELTLMPVPAS